MIVGLRHGNGLSISRFSNHEPSEPDYLGGTTYCAVNSHGTHVEVCATTDDIPVDEIVRALPPGTSSLPASQAHVRYTLLAEGASGKYGSQKYLLRRNQTPLLCTGDVEMLLSALQADAAWQVATGAQTCMFLHAGTVVYQQYGILLPGASGAGKSTLVSRLLRMGAVYYSDEYAPLDIEGHIYPFPCPIKLKDGERLMRRVDVVSFGATIGIAPMRSRLIAFPRYRCGAQLQIEAVPRSLAMLEMLRHMPETRTNPRKAMQTSVAVAQNAACFVIEYGDSDEAAIALVEMLREKAGNDSRPAMISALEESPLCETGQCFDDRRD